MIKAQFSKISYLMLETNSSCNLACLSCNRKDLEEQGLRTPRNLTEEELIFILDQFKECPVDTIKFEGLSEPMLHPRFDRLSEILRQRFPDAFVIIATNLSYNIEKTPFFRTLPHVSQVYVSIDGIGELHERLRPHSSFKKVLSSLTKISELAPSRERAKIFINFTASRENYRDLPAIYGLKEKFGLAGVRINLVQDWDGTSPFSHSFPDEMIEAMRLYKQDIKGVPGWDYRDCFWPFNGVVIDVYGDVRQCVINTNATPLGNIFETPIQELFDSPAYKNMRLHLNDNRPDKSCINCSYKALSPYLQKLFGPDFVHNQPRRKEL